jgi:hypothetical protein
MVWGSRLSRSSSARRAAIAPIFASFARTRAANSALLAASCSFLRRRAWLTVKSSLVERAPKWCVLVLGVYGLVVVMDIGRLFIFLVLLVLQVVIVGGKILLWWSWVLISVRLDLFVWLMWLLVLFSCYCCSLWNLSVLALYRLLIGWYY